MRALSVSLLALAATAFVIPDEQTAQALRLQNESPEPESSFWDNIPSIDTVWEETEQRAEKIASTFKSSWDDFVDAGREAAVHYGDKFESALEATGEWLESTAESEVDLLEHRPPPHHGPGRGRPHRPPHHPPHHGHGPPNMTVYELIAKSKYTTKLAKLINEYDDLVKLLNGTKANYTVFAPTDRAFEKIPEHLPKPSKKDLERILTYHVSPEFYPAGRILVTRTIPTALKAKYISKAPQRLSTQIGFRGLTVNYYAKVVAPNIFGTNGVIHGIDSILVPPPKIIDIISAFPGEFSTLDLALYKTDLASAFNDTKSKTGGTLFAPSNYAFKRLGPRLNAFLFSSYGTKYLKALILYHAVPNITLYSDAVYNSAKSEDHRIPKGVYHIDLPTGLEGKKLSVDVARYGRLITIKINGFFRVSVTDGIAADGVLHVLPNVLIPPKKPGATPDLLDENMSVEEVVERLEPYTQQDQLSVHDWEL